MFMTSRLYEGFKLYEYRSQRASTGVRTWFSSLLAYPGFSTFHSPFFLRSKLLNPSNVSRLVRHGPQKLLGWNERPSRICYSGYLKCVSATTASSICLCANESLKAFPKKRADINPDTMSSRIPWIKRPNWELKYNLCVTCWLPRKY